MPAANLCLDISFIYKEATPTVAVRTQQTTRRGGVTALQLAERAELLEEQEAAGQTTVWKEVYSLMRCTGPPCQGTYCWRDPENWRHYKLDTSVLTKLVDYAEEGNTVRTHGDVPPWIRELIYAKDQRDSERRSGSDKPPSRKACLRSTSRMSCLQVTARTQLAVPLCRPQGLKPLALGL